MFGYIKTDRANLLGKEYDAYRGIYCGLCKQLGREYSIFARLILSYDCTFYAMFAMSLAEDTPSYCAECCRFNPLKKCIYAETKTKALSLAAALSVSSAYYKLRDDLLDSPWYKRIVYRLFQPVFSLWHKKSRKKYPDIDKALEKAMVDQISAESDPNCSIDKAAEPTANMLAAVCELIPDEIEVKSSDTKKLKRVLRAFGYFLGRWVYLIDAADDLEKDKKSGSFNPYLSLDTADNNIAEAILPTLNHALSETLLSYGLLDKGRFDSIILNVLKDSCVKVQNEILTKYNGEKNEKSI